ncbi:MAG TPA: prepilin peptidase [Fervidobacterium sp.]|nr:prepilin peptidase [Fervidobacterium sp.]HUM75570.1 prepilin peptidase [Fervidobacterium sp.]
MWNSLILLFWFIIGAIFGSFANVLIYRPMAGLKLTEPRFSICPNCGATIRWYDNVPILSYLVLRGRCRDCGAKISIRYPIIEITYALSFLLNHAIFPMDLAIVLDIIFTVSVPAIFIDLRKMLLPDYTWICTLVASIYANLYHFSDYWLLDIIGAVVALTILLLLKMRYKDGIGAGDLFLLPTFAYACGFVYMPFLLLFSSLLGIIFGAVKKSKVIPFGPAIISVGYVLVFLRYVLK